MDVLAPSRIQGLQEGGGICLHAQRWRTVRTRAESRSTYALHGGKVTYNTSKNLVWVFRVTRTAHYNASDVEITSKKVTHSARAMFNYISAYRGFPDANEATDLAINLRPDGMNGVGDVFPPFHLLLVPNSRRIGVFSAWIH